MFNVEWKSPRVVQFIQHSTFNTEHSTFAFRTSSPRGHPPARFAEAGHPARAPLVEGDAGDALEGVGIVGAMDAQQALRAERVAEVLRERVGEDVEAAAFALR